MPFHLDPDLRAAFQGYQGQFPLKSCVIFLGKDANFPKWNANPPVEFQQEQRVRILSFLTGGEWRDGAQFRISQVYANRNENSERAHHPFLLNCFPGNRDGARYHTRIAQLIDRVIDKNEFRGNQIVAQCSFVELVRYATVGNNGSLLNNLFKGDTPDEWNGDEGFQDAQTQHREKLLSWLFEDRVKNACSVFVPKSVFKFLCEEEWGALNGGCLRQMNEYFDNNQKALIFDKIVLNRNRWIITKYFPYFRRTPANIIDGSLNAIANKLVEALNP